ncbi:acyloxyacyl hydrolase [Aestuariirhabdus sp. LZHN29]|uniref:acyloxyacyl hydrolase n=1 Tax=Aestuariirhabdus sp. LZHN29 TaxID=3417462 RepID=UPI003CF1DE35
MRLAKVVPLLTALAIAPFSTPGFTQDDYRLTVGAGVFDPLGSGTTGMIALTLEGEPIEAAWDIRPTLLGFTIEQSGYYVGMGGHREFEIDDDWRWGVATGLGYYHEGSEDNELGYDLEFFTRLSLSYQLTNKQLIRGEFGHISNAGLGDSNPGAETVTLSWVTPF